jgi:AmmeMemoRadiSam system protein B
MSTEQLPDHIIRPHLRPIQPVPVTKDGVQYVALRDPSMLMDKMMVVPMPVMRYLQLFQGDRTLDELAAMADGKVEQLAQLVTGLDNHGLLWGPTFEQLESQRLASLQEAGVFPARTSTTLGDDDEACREALGSFFEQTEDPELEETVVGIVAPHLDFQRGWPNYAAAYFALQGADAPDRVVVLGTNHFGVGDGVVMTELGFETPIGRCPVDEVVTGRLVERLGRDLIVDQLDHFGEHSIELQVPWLQYCFGNVPIVAALIPDPLQDMLDEEGSQRITLERFVETMKEVLADVGGRTLFVASSDLSHVGPQFGEPRPVDDQRRVDVERHDRDMMAKYLAGDAEEFLAAMRWNKNPTRWCSIGNMTALLMLTEADTVELIDYRQAYDEQGVALVSSAAMAVMKAVA